MKRKTRLLITITTILLATVMLTGCIGNPYKAGIKSLEKGEFAEAVNSFNEAIKEEKNLADSYRGLGIALWETKDYQGAFSAMESALEQGSKESVTIHSIMGNCSMEIKDYETAIEHYETALSMDDISEELKKETRYNLIAAYEYAGNVDKAKEKLEEYIADYPDDESALRETEFLETR